jgi:hypothetical protein
MTSHELLKQIKLLLTGVVADEGPSYFVEIVTSLSQIGNEEFQDTFDEFSKRPRFADFLRGLMGRSTQPKKRRDSDELMHDLTSFLASIDLKRYFISLTEYEFIVRDIDLNLQNTEVGTFRDHVGTFAKKMETYIRKESLSTIYEVLEAAEEISRDFRILNNFRQFINNNLGRSSTAVTGEGELSLFLTSKTDYQQLLEKLQSLRVIYEELCSLFGVSSKEIPLEIGKVESGSLWIKVFGESRVISAMISLVESTVHFLHRNFTNEGRIMALPRRIESVTSFLELEQKLKEAGMDTSELKEYIKKSSVLIGRNLTQLLSGEAKVEVNDNVYSLGTELEQVYLAQAHRFLLSDSDDAPDSDDKV